jgi:hypothetical protein
MKNVKILTQGTKNWHVQKYPAHDDDVSTNARARDDYYKPIDRSTNLFREIPTRNQPQQQ